MVSCTCRDLGIDCSYETTGTTEREIMKKFHEHFVSAHKIHVLTADVIFKIQKGIKKLG